ncbi:hypothetical protein KSP40_PGU015403 [Platanthera guangdongensis]|uniref:YqaJ viral recombinase domain-containing protein n=1 Tax=Platanthera guangdongensis TaxID=2320717 RepID=A0ABR2MSC3_9ASPA
MASEGVHHATRFARRSLRSGHELGTRNKAAAIERYRSMTRNDVSFQGFAVSVETGSGWLDASPDGLVGCHPDAEILEVKCPYNKGRSELGSSWKTTSYYYMSQVQGQMEIMDRDWVDLYCWMPNGSVLFRVFRDREYWGLMHRMQRVSGGERSSGETGGGGRGRGGNDVL